MDFSVFLVSIWVAGSIRTYDLDKMELDIYYSSLGMFENYTHLLIFYAFLLLAYFVIHIE